MMITALHNTRIISAGNIYTGKAILIKNDQIIAVVDETDVAPDAHKINLNGNYLAPGLIDLQIYGSGTELFAGKPTVSALRQLEDDLINEGTIGFFATIGTNTNEVVEQGIEVAKTYREIARGNFWGLHLEGPYLNEKKKGAHPANLIKKASLAEVKRWVEAADGVIAMMTIAPELQDQEVIDYLHQKRIILSSGHSNATYQEGKSFLNEKIPAVTHLFNAMPQMHHRDPGYIPAIFEQRPYTSIVNDGVHVDFAMVRMAKHALGNRLFFITDRVTGATEGTYQHQFAGDRFVMPDGTLSGSCLTMLKAVENGVKQVGISLPEAINMASLYPAQLASRTQHGRVEPGFFADLIAFDDDFNVTGTVFKGEWLTK
jgi:N-acetylglucosamine-6-phosphate deacetylase